MYPGSKGRKNKRAMTIATSVIQGSNSRSTSITNSELASKRKSDSSFIPASPTEVSDKHCGVDGSDDVKEKPWTWDQPFHYDVPRAEDSDPWEKCYELSKKHDDVLIEAWRDEVEHLLIFAGLFSAVVTAFAVESYKGLQRDPSEATIVLLTIIAAQLGANSSSIQQLSPTSGGMLPSPATSLNVQLNVFHFLSLTLSISTVLIGILCLQWLREYDHDVGLPHKDSVALRQMRYEGLLAWKVPSILSALPVILQVALVLFFIGLLELLWTLDKVVASLVTVAVGLTLLFLVVTTVIPTLQYFLFVHDGFLKVHQCPYKSPQSWAFHKLVRRTVWIASKISPGFLTAVWMATRRSLRYVESLKDGDWAGYDIRWYNARKSMSPDLDTMNALTWIEKTYAAPRIDVIETIAHCMKDVSFKVVPTTVETLPKALNDVIVTRRKDVAIALFLERHRTRHPELSVPHLESVIRAINSDPKLIPYHRWPVHDISELPYDVVTQLLMSVKTLISSDRVKLAQDVLYIWDLIHLVLSKQSGPSWKRLSVEIIDELQLFSTRLVTTFSQESTPIKEVDSEHPRKIDPHIMCDMNPTSDLKSNPTDIVIECAHGMIRVFPIINQEEVFSQFNVPTWKVSVVKQLNDCVGQLGGAAKIFGPTVRKRWNKLLRQTLPPEEHRDIDVVETPILGPARDTTTNIGVS